MSKILSTLSIFNTLSGSPDVTTLPKLEKPTPIVQIANVSMETQKSISSLRCEKVTKFEIPTEADIVEKPPVENKVYTDKQEIFEVLGFGNSKKFGPVEMYIFVAGGKYYFRVNYKNSPKIYSNYEFEAYYSRESIQIIMVRFWDPVKGEFATKAMKINNSAGQFPVKQ
jgi:hypothetical protein